MTAIYFHWVVSISVRGEIFGKYLNSKKKVSFEWNIYNIIRCFTFMYRSVFPRSYCSDICYSIVHGRFLYQFGKLTLLIKRAKNCLIGFAALLQQLYFFLRSDVASRHVSCVSWLSGDIDTDTMNNAFVDNELHSVRVKSSFDLLKAFEFDTHVYRDTLN